MLFQSIISNINLENTGLRKPYLYEIWVLKSKNELKFKIIKMNELLIFPEIFAPNRIRTGIRSLNSLRNIFIIEKVGNRSIILFIVHCDY